MERSCNCFLLAPLYPLYFFQSIAICNLYTTWRSASACAASAQGRNNSRSKARNEQSTHLTTWNGSNYVTTIKKCATNRKAQLVLLKIIDQAPSEISLNIRAILDRTNHFIQISIIIIYPARFRINTFLRDEVIPHLKVSFHDCSYVISASYIGKLVR